MNRFNLLCGLVLFDVVFTIYGVKCLGATEVNLICQGLDFDLFMFLKIIISVEVLTLIYFMRKDKYIKIGMSVLIVLYGAVAISNLWQVVNYIYY